MERLECAMRCEEREADLLLLPLGELPLMRRLQTRAHLLRCPHCRERQERLMATSAMIAQTLRPPHFAGTIPHYRVVESGNWLRLISLAILLAILVFLTYRVAITLSGQGQVAVTGKASTIGCTPNLRNDHCR